MNAEQQSKVWDQIVAKALADAAFKRRLLADPAAVLAEHAIPVPPGIQFRIVEDTEQVRHLVLPMCRGGEMTEGELARVAAGVRVTRESPDIITGAGPGAPGGHA
jgi:hypothetical protein